MPRAAYNIGLRKELHGKCEKANNSISENQWCVTLIKMKIARDNIEKESYEWKTEHRQNTAAIETRSFKSLLVFFLLVSSNTGSPGLQLRDTKKEI